MKKSKVVSLFALSVCVLSFHGMSATAGECTVVNAERYATNPNISIVQQMIESGRAMGMGENQEVEFITLESQEKGIEEKLDFTDQLVVFDVNDFEEPVVFTDCHVTAYCNCEKCCGKYAWKHTTATGAETVEGVTIAVDPKVIPYGSIVELNGHFYIAQDCGGAIDGVEIDVYIDDVGGSHLRCKEFMGELGQDFGNEIRVWMPKQ